MCWKCDLRAVMGQSSGDNPEAVRRGGDLIASYMREHNVSFPEAVEALGEVRRQEYSELAAVYGERHGLSPEEVDMAFWRHGIDGPAVLQ